MEAGTKIGTDWPYLMVAGGSRRWPWWGVDEVITDWAPLPESPPTESEVGADGWGRWGGTSLGPIDTLADGRGGGSVGAGLGSG